MQQIYVTDFIVPAFHNAMSDYTRKEFKGYSKLLKPIDEKIVQLRISDDFNKKVISLSDGKKFKNEQEKAAYNNFLAWIASSKVRPINGDEYNLINYRDAKIRRSVAQLFGPSLIKHISSTIHDHEFEVASNEKEKIKGIVQKLLISDSDISENKYGFLFTVEELEKIDPQEKKDWHRYIYDYSVPTENVRIVDPYFIKSNREIGIRTILGKLIGGSPFEELGIEIITNLSKSFDKDRPEEYQQKAIQWIEKNSDQPVNITIYDVKRNHSNYHDRYLWTDYWNLKVPAGIDGKIDNNTIPTIVGRYSSKQGSWNYVNDNWDNWINEDCDLINTNK